MKSKEGREEEDDDQEEDDDEDDDVNVGLAAHLRESGMRSKGRAHRLYCATPIARSGLSEQTHCWIPDCGGSAATPTPIAVSMQKRPYRNAERTSQMGRHGIDGDHEIHLEHSGTGLIDCLAVGSSHCTASNLPKLLLQGEQSGARHFGQSLHEAEWYASTSIPNTRLPGEPNTK